MERKCMYCNDPIYECMGYVIPRDILPVLKAFFEGRKYEGRQPRELCHRDECNDKWKEQVRRDIENEQTSTNSKS